MILTSILNGKQTTISKPTIVHIDESKPRVVCTKGIRVDNERVPCASTTVLALGGELTTSGEYHFRNLFTQI